MSELVADASVAAQRGTPQSAAGEELAVRWQALVKRLDLVTGRAFTTPDGAVARFAITLSDDPNLAGALNFLRQAVTAHPPSRRRKTRK